MNIIFIIPAELSRCQGRSINPYCIELLKQNHNILVLYKNGVEDTGFQSPQYHTLALSWENGHLCSGLLSKVIDFNPDIVHVWNPWKKILSAGLQCCEKTSAKLILHHEDDLEYHTKQTTSIQTDQKYDNVFHINTISKSHGLTAIWKPISYDLLSYEKPISIMPPGLNTCEILSESNRSKIKETIGKELKIPSQSLILGYSGSIRYLDKEFETFLKAFQYSSSKNPSYLLIWGRDWNPYLTDFLIKKYNLQNKVFLLGFLPEKEAFELQQAVDILCCPGFNSSFNQKRLPSRLCNYFYFGKAIFMHRIGFGESLQNDVDAVLTETDNFNEWAEKLQLLMDNSPLRKTLEQHSSLVAKKYFNMQENTQKLISFYKTILSGSKKVTTTADLSTHHIPTGKYKVPVYESKYKLCAMRNVEYLKERNIKKIAFYGAGQHTEQLFKTGKFKDLTITAIIDSNRTGKLDDIPIYHPSATNLPSWETLFLSTDSIEEKMKKEADFYNLSFQKSMYEALYTPILSVWGNSDA